MHQPSGRHRRPRRTLAGRAWAIAAALLAAVLTYVFVPPTPGRERAALSPAPDRPRLPAAPVPPTPCATPVPAPRLLTRGPGDFPERRARVASARDTSTRRANGYRLAGPGGEAGPLARPYMPPPPEPRPFVPRPRMPEGDLLAAPPPARHRTSPVTPDRAGGLDRSGGPSAQSNPDDMDDLAAVIRTYLAVIG